VRPGTSTVAACGTDAAAVQWIDAADLDRCQVTSTAIAVIRKALASFATRT